MKHLSTAFLCVLLTILLGCSGPSDQSTEAVSEAGKGVLYIVGGGKRPPEMVQEMIDLSGVSEEGYVVVLPMASSEPDTSFYYARKQFTDLGVQQVFNYHFKKGAEFPQSKLDSLTRAPLIYLPGGEQARFMDFVRGTPVYEALHQAYQQGAVIAGTSAGAAVMSKKMITGNEYKHPEYTGDFRTIEAENMELLEGMGLLEYAIIDQHFIWRMRMNRLIAVAIENPGYTCIGIDESTAVVVQGDSARVAGVSQVVVLRSNQKEYSVQDGLLGSENIDLKVYVPGDAFLLYDIK